MKKIVVTDEQTGSECAEFVLPDDHALRVMNEAMLCFHTPPAVAVNHACEGVACPSCADEFLTAEAQRDEHLFDDEVRRLRVLHAEATANAAAIQEDLQRRLNEAEARALNAECVRAAALESAARIADEAAANAAEPGLYVAAAKNIARRIRAHAKVA